MIEEDLKKLPTTAKIQLLREIYANDVHRYFKNLVRTLDEQDTTGQPIKKIPDWPYIAELITAYQAHKCNLVWKSRQIMATWITIAYALWIVLFHKGKKVAIQSKKSDDADALIQRMKIIYDALPAWKPKAEFSYCRIKLEEMNSDVYGIPQGPDQLRSYTFSFIFSDEVGFQTDLEKTFGAIKPLIDGGATCVWVTTPPREKNFSYICKQNSSGLWNVIEVHYSKRPDRDETWKKQAKLGWSEDDWNRENELQMVQSGVTRVLSDFSERTHINAGLIYNRDLLLYRVWDFGFHRPFCGWFQIDTNDRVVVLHCLLGRDTLIDKFAENVLQISVSRFPNAVVQDFCDIAGTQVSDKNEKTSVQILQSKGIIPAYRKFNEEDGLNLIRRKLSVLIGDKAGFQIHPSCQYLIDGALYGVVYGRDGKTIRGDGLNEFGEDEKDYFLHGWDAIRYGICNLYTVQGQRQSQNLKTSALMKSIMPIRARVGR